MNWVSKKELPEKSGPYLIRAETADPNKPFRAMGWYEKDENNNGYLKGFQLFPKIFMDSITHWMKIDEPKQ